MRRVQPLTRRVPHPGSFARCGVPPGTSIHGGRVDPELVRTTVTTLSGFGALGKYALLFFFPFVRGQSGRFGVALATVIRAARASKRAQSWCWAAGWRLTRTSGIVVAAQATKAARWRGRRSAIILRLT